MRRSSSASATPHTSPIASTAPTSWKCTCSGSTAWIRRLGVGEPPERLLRPRRAPARAGRRRRSARGSSASRAAAGRARRRSSRAWRPCACRLTRSVRSSRPATPSRGQARRATACGVGAGVEQRAEQHVAGDAGRRSRGTATRLTRAPPAERAIRAAIVPAPNPSSMLTTASPAAHETSIDEQRAHPAERGAVAGARRHADDRRAHEPADHARRARRPGPRPRPRSRPRRRSSSAGASRCSPATPASAWTTTRVPSSSARTRASVTTGPVRRPARHDRHAARATAGTRPRDPREPRPRVLLGVRRHPPQGLPSGRVGPRHQHAARAALQQRPRDRLDLLGRLALREDRLRRALAQLAVRVHAREAELAERQLAHPCQRVARRRLAALDGLEHREHRCRIGHDRQRISPFPPVSARVAPAPGGGVRDATRIGGRAAARPRGARRLWPEQRARDARPGGQPGRSEHAHLPDERGVHAAGRGARGGGELQEGVRRLGPPPPGVAPVPHGHPGLAGARRAGAPARARAGRDRARLRERGLVLASALHPAEGARAARPLLQQGGGRRPAAVRAPHGPRARRPPLRVVVEHRPAAHLPQRRPRAEGAADVGRADRRPRRPPTRRTPRSTATSTTAAATRAPSSTTSATSGCRAASCSTPTGGPCSPRARTGRRCSRCWPSCARR